MIRRSTVVYIVLLLALAGAYYYLNNRTKSADIEVTAEATGVAQAYLFTAADGTPTSIRIKSKTGDTVEVARGADNAWAVIQPIKAKADQAAVEAAATQITTISILDTVPDIDPKIVGLETPEGVLTVKFTNGGERSVDIGVITPTESGYYVRNTDGKIVIVSKSAIDSLLGMLIAPPYLETLTPPPVSQTPEGSPSAIETAPPQP
jgi:hypothetical protein